MFSSSDSSRIFSFLYWENVLIKQKKNLLILLFFANVVASNDFVFVITFDNLDTYSFPHLIRLHSQLNFLYFSLKSFFKKQKKFLREVFFSFKIFYPVAKSKNENFLSDGAFSSISHKSELTRWEFLMTSGNSSMKLSWSKCNSFILKLVFN